VALDHRPQISAHDRSGQRILVCARCNRFLGLAHVDKPRMPGPLGPAAGYFANIKTKSAH
jgi:hypothetical protein